MFQSLKSLFRSPRHETNQEQIATLNLNGKPFAQALLLRAAHYQDEAAADLSRSGIPADATKHTSLAEATSSCAATIAYHVTTEALTNLGHEGAYLPQDPIPKHAPMAVAFSLLVLANIHVHLEAEGIPLDFQKVAIRTAGLFFLAHPDDVRTRHVAEGIAAFRSVAEADALNVKEWRDSLGKLVLAYVLEWTASGMQPKQMDFPSLFAGLLSGSLKAVE